VAGAATADVRLIEGQTVSAAVITSHLPEKNIGMELQFATCPFETDLFRLSLARG